MKANRTNAYVTTALTGLVGLVGCGNSRGLVSKTNYQRDSVRLETPGHISGHELRDVSEKDNKYKLEEVVAHGQRLFVGDNSYNEDNELDFTLVKYEDHSRIIDRGSKIIEITSDKLYIPTAMQKGDNSPARIFNFDTEGDYALRADITQFNTAGIQTGIIRTDQRDAGINIKTIEIGKREFYLPRANSEETTNLSNQNVLDFYLIPVDGTTIEISSDGRISLISLSGIYRPVEISRDNFEEKNGLRRVFEESQAEIGANRAMDINEDLKNTQQKSKKENTGSGSIER